MSRAMLRWRPTGLSVLVDPGGAMGAAVAGPRPAAAATVIASSVLVLGLGSVPRQLSILERALPLSGHQLLDAQQRALAGGLTRLILWDRLVPSPTLLLAALLLGVLAEPVLMLGRERRAAIGAVVLLGLTPLVVGRLGELVITYLLPLAAQPAAGEAIRAPHRFATGPLLFWLSSDPAPTWLEVLNAKLNLISLWCLGLWAIGLRSLDGRRFEAWHLALPAACLAAAGLFTWIATPLVLPVLMR